MPIKESHLICYIKHNGLIENLLGCPNCTLWYICLSVLCMGFKWSITHRGSTIVWLMLATLLSYSYQVVQLLIMWFFLLQFELAKGYLKPVLGGTIVDASCGSGLFSRTFAKSGLFSLVVALDFSENMLRQCYEFIKQEEGFPKE